MVSMPPGEGIEPTDTSAPPVEKISAVPTKRATTLTSSAVSLTVMPRGEVAMPMGALDQNQQHYQSPPSALLYSTRHAG